MLTRQWFTSHTHTHSLSLSLSLSLFLSLAFARALSLSRARALSLSADHSDIGASCDADETVVHLTPRGDPWSGTGGSDDAGT
jgi:hypothetical protein